MSDVVGPADPATAPEVGPQADGRLAIGVVRLNDDVVVSFARPITTVILSREEAIGFARALWTQARAELPVPN